MTTRQISETLMDIYGFEASEGFISDVTDKLLSQIEEWQKRPFERDLSSSCNAPSEQAGRETLDEVTGKWEEKYP